MGLEGLGSIARDWDARLPKARGSGKQVAKVDHPTLDTSHTHP